MDGKPCTKPYVHVSGSADYENYRRSFVNADVPSKYPLEIHMPTSVEEVVDAVKRADELGISIGVRSGGHAFPCPSLIDGGILIDMSNLNRRLNYNSQTHEIDFGPAVRVREAMDVLMQHGRFFPTGHAPSVALGGFCLAGGQGWFMRSWGMTVDQWVTKIEIVTPSGAVLTASKEQNSDLFWAARGSGQMFFGVVTRIWGRTIPAKKLFHHSLLFQVRENFSDLLGFALERNNRTPKYGTETAMCTFYPQKYDPKAEGDDIPQPTTLMMAIEVIAYTDTIGEAQTLLSAFDSIPENLHSLILQDDKVRSVTWDELFGFQDALVPWGNGERWICDSILDDPSCPVKTLAKAVKPAMCNLPTRSSAGCIYIGDTYPDEKDQVCSLPQRYYIATFVGYKDASRDVELKRWVKNVYKEVEKVSCGMYIADYNHGHRVTPQTLTPTAQKRFMEIRRRYDPNGRFPCPWDEKS